MKNEIEEFINRRFQNKDNWLSGNCYYFALILKERFNGEIYYDPIDGHFMCLIDGFFYDWTGKLNIEKERLIEWSTYSAADCLHYLHIKEDCID